MTAEWLSAVYGDDVPETDWLSIFVRTTDGKISTRWARCDDYDAAADEIADGNADGDVWLGVATRKTKLARGRGGGTDLAHLPGLWLDIDIANADYHADDNLPANVDDARRLLARFPLAPTAIVDSGHGLQPWWLFSEPVPVDDDVVTLLDRWGSTWQARAAEFGWTLDFVFDTPRVLRIPGTINRKVNRTTGQPDAAPVVVVESDWTRRYHPTDIDDLLDEVETAGESPAISTQPSRSDGWLDQVIADYNARSSWDEVLAGHFERRHTDRQGITYWHADGAANDTGATTNANGTDRLIVFSGTAHERGWPQAPTSLDRFSAHVLTATGMHDDVDTRVEVARALQKSGYGPAPVERVDLRALVGGDATTTEIERTAGTVEGALADGFRGTDAGNAGRFDHLARGRIHFVHAWEKWIVYEAHGFWTIDTGGARIMDAAKLVPKRLFAAAAKLNGRDRDDLWAWAKRTEAATSLRSMVYLTRGTPGVLVDHYQLDRDPWLLNVVNGTVDLRTGQLLDHDPAHLLTKQAPVVYSERAVAPLWLECVERWQPDPEMRRYLQCAIGSAATGHPVEHLFVNIGAGGNGKSKFYGAVQRILGPYAMVPDKSLFVVARHEPHPTVKAGLFGARMLLAPETEQGDRLAESAIKELTGGDRMTGRRMREDFWEFWPTWTAFMHTNHRPRVRGTDEGVWRRLRLIPWEVTIPEHERDPQLADKLAREASGILNWIIEGAVAYHEQGLVDPASVRAATEAYRTESDLVARFLDETGYVVDTSLWTPSTDLAVAHENWCIDSGLDHRRQWQNTAEGLKKLGAKPARTGARGRHWRGLGRGTDVRV
jgi:putative DNA primase/helicase